MSLRTAVKDISALPRLQCLRRTLTTTTTTTPPQKSPKKPSPRPPPHGQNKITLTTDIPPNPSSLDNFPSKILNFKFQSTPAGIPVEKPVVAAPLPRGYNEHAYTNAIKIAAEGREPTREEVTDLLKLMDFDSPLGEMKYEALAIFREMRSRGVIPTYIGYEALLNVRDSGTWGDCRWLPRREIR
jgi:hypothetical protein